MKMLKKKKKYSFVISSIITTVEKNFGKIQIQAELNFQMRLRKLDMVLQLVSTQS